MEKTESQGTCCLFLSLETGTALIAFFILFSLITQIGLVAYLKVMVTPMIAVYLLHCILYFVVHWWLGFDSVQIRRLLYFTCIGCTVAYVVYGVLIVDFGLGGIMDRDCKDSDYKGTCDPNEQMLMGNLTLVGRTLLYTYFVYVHGRYLEAKKMEQPYV